MKGATFLSLFLVFVGAFVIVITLQGKAPALKDALMSSSKVVNNKK